MNPNRPINDVTPPNAPSPEAPPANPPAGPNPAPASSPFSPPSPHVSAAPPTQPTAPQPARLDVNNLPLPPTANASATPPTNSNERPTTSNAPLLKTPIETPNPKASRGGWLRDIVGLGVFITVVIVGAWLINMLVFRSFNVVGPSMEPTLEGENGRSDRLIVNLLPVTGSRIAGNDWVPSRGQIIVFKNPRYVPGSADEYIVKRVIGLPGERVTVADCTLKVYNSEHPDGFNPYTDFKNFAENDAEVNTCIDGDGTNVTIPDGEIFVVGDHRVNNYSMDSRDGSGRASLGTIPLDDIVGPVAMRIWPFDQLKLF